MSKLFRIFFFRRHQKLVHQTNVESDAIEHELRRLIPRTPVLIDSSLLMARKSLAAASLASLADVDKVLWSNGVRRRGMHSIHLGMSASSPLNEPMNISLEHASTRDRFRSNAAKRQLRSKWTESSSSRRYHLSCVTILLFNFSKFLESDFQRLRRNDPERDIPGWGRGLAFA